MANRFKKKAGFTPKALHKQLTVSLRDSSRDSTTGSSNSGIPISRKSFGKSPPGRRSLAFQLWNRYLATVTWCLHLFRFIKKQIKEQKKTIRPARQHPISSSPQSFDLRWFSCHAAGQLKNGDHRITHKWENPMIALPVRIRSGIAISQRPVITSQCQRVTGSCR